jgi:hypothetical protein
MKDPAVEAVVVGQRLFPVSTSCSYFLNTSQVTKYSASVDFSTQLFCRAKGSPEITPRLGTKKSSPGPSSMTDDSGPVNLHLHFWLASDSQISLD